MFLFLNNPDKNWYKLLSLKMNRKSIVDEATKEKVDVQVTTTVSRVVKKRWFSKKKKTYLYVTTIVIYDDNTKIITKIVKL